MIAKQEDKVQGSHSNKKQEIITEKVDDIVPVISYLEKMGL